MFWDLKSMFLIIHFSYKINNVQKYGTDFYHVSFLLFPTLLSSLTETPQVVKNDYFEHGPDENK